VNLVVLMSVTPTQEKFDREITHSRNGQ